MIVLHVNEDILFESERLRMRKITGADEDFMIGIFCDKTMMQFLGDVWTEEFTGETMLEWIKEWGVNNYYYGIIEKMDDGEKIGIAGISEDTNPNEPGIEFSWFINSAHQNNGYASEITREMLGFVFGSLEKDRLFAETGVANAASNRVLEKNGFTNIGNRNYTYDYIKGMDEQALWEYRRENWATRMKSASHA